VVSGGAKLQASYRQLGHDINADVTKRAAENAEIKMRKTMQTPQNRDARAMGSHVQHSSAKMINQSPT
jgi:hypothetical protein